LELVVLVDHAELLAVSDRGDPRLRERAQLVEARERGRGRQRALAGAQARLPASGELARPVVGERDAARGRELERRRRDGPRQRDELERELLIRDVVRVLGDHEIASRRWARGEPDAREGGLRAERGRLTDAEAERAAAAALDIERERRALHGPELDGD